MPSGTIYYDNLPETAGSSYNAEAFAKGHRRFAFIPQSTGDAAQTGTINDAAVLSAIGNIEWLDEIRYGMLDFETPYITHLAEGVSDVSSANYQAALAELVDLIGKVRAAYPQIQWAFYRIPTARFFLFNNTWLGLEQTGQTNLIEERLAGYVAAYSPLVAAQDYVCVEILDRYVAPERDEQTKRFHFYAVEAAKRCNAENGEGKEILANIAVAHQYTDNYDGYTPTFIPLTELFEETVVPAIGNGCRTLMLWTGYTFWIPAVYDVVTYPIDHTQAPDATAQLRAYRVNRYRQAFAEDFFNGVAPDWASGAEEDTLRAAVAEKMTAHMDALQRMVRLKGAARRSTLETLGGIDPGPIG